MSLDGTSSWVVAKDPCLTGLIISEGAVVEAPEGCKLTITVNGVKKEIKSGNYSGKIALIIIKS